MHPKVEHALEEIDAQLYSSENSPEDLAKIQEYVYRWKSKIFELRQPEQVEIELQAAASFIRHCGDYGELWWNRKERKAWWVGGDSDGQVSSGHTHFNDIKRLLKVPGVEEVEIADEYSPDDDNNDWKCLGKFGTEMYGGLYDGFVSEFEKGLKLEPADQLEPGWMVLTFTVNPKLTKRSLCHVGISENGFYPVYAFHGQRFLQLPRQPVNVSKMERIVGGLDPAWDAAIADIYKYRKEIE